MTGFALIFATAISVGLAVGFASCALFGGLAAVGTALILAAIYRTRFVRQVVMELMHRITGQ